MTLDLSTPRGLGALLATTYDLQVRWFGVFFAVTALINVPFLLILVAVSGHGLGHLGEGDTWRAVDTVSSIGSNVVLPALVTALHVRIVERLGVGEQATVGSAFRLIVPAILPALAAVLLYTLGVALGFLALIVPGIYLMVHWYFAAQEAVVSGFAGALRRSGRLVSGRWWTVAGRLLAISVIVAAAVGLPQIGVRAATDDDYANLAAAAVLGTIGLSIHALFGTLLFFSLRAEKAATDAAPVPSA